MIMGSDIEKALALYDRPDIRDCILDFSNEEHVQAVQQVIAAFPEAARRALAADERVKELERIHQALTQTATELGCSFCGKPREETRSLIAGLKVYICDECLDLCNRIVDDMKLKVNAEEVSE